MENNFNLKKFLIENKLTSNSRVLSEASGKSEALAKAKASHNAKMSKLKGQSQGASGGVTRAREDKEIERYEKEVERINKKFTNNEVADGSSEASGKSKTLNEGLNGGVYEIPKDVPEMALKPYIGKFLQPTDAQNDMVSRAREYDKEGGFFKVGQEVELKPAVALSSFGKSLGKPEKAKDDNEKPKEYRDESGRRVKNPNFNIRKVSYKLVN